MKAFIKDKKIYLTDPLPETLQDGDEIEISIVQIKVNPRQGGSLLNLPGACYYSLGIVPT
jgi:hypothetical protein